MSKLQNAEDRAYKAFMFIEDDGLTQQEACKRANVSQATYVKYKTKWALTPEMPEVFEKNIAKKQSSSIDNLAELIADSTLHAKLKVEAIRTLYSKI